MRLGGYVRNSVYDKTLERSQEEPADSPARQERDLQRLANARGDEVVKVYSDLDFSAWSGRERPAFEELIEDAEAGLIDGIIVWKLDRLTRNFDDLQRIWKLVKSRGFRLVSVHDSIDTSTRSGVLGLRMGIAIAEMESSNTSLRVRAAMEEAARNGKPHAGGTSRPFGYTDHSRQYIHPIEAPAIREAIDQLLTGATLASVVQAVNDQGIRTPKGKTWRTGTFAEMLTSPGLAGLRVHKGTEYKGTWKAIVTPDEHARLVAMRRDPARVWTHSGQPRKHLLAGLLYCGREGCGEKLYSKPVRGVPRYKCSPQPFGRGCGRVSISAPHIEAVVVERLFTALDTAELAEAIRAPDDTDPDLARQLDEDDQALKQAAHDHYVTKILPRPAFLDTVAELEGRIRQTRARQARQAKAAVFAELPAGIDAVKAAWEGWDLERRRALIDACIAKIKVDPAKLGSRQGRAFDRSRVRITWRV